MQICFLRKEGKAADLFAKQGNRRTFVRTVCPSFAEVLSDGRKVPYRKGSQSDEKEGSFWSTSCDSWMTMEVIE